MKQLLISTLTVLFLVSSSGLAEESRIATPEGFETIELLSDTAAITPGVPFRLGMLFTLLPDYHTYWRGPGIVGVAPTFEWDLPEGFQVGKTYWPAPEIVDMAGIKANGYHDKVLIITEITPPETFDGRNALIKLRAAWMACASSCHPGLGDFSMTLPVQEAGSSARPNKSIAARFEKSIETIPPAAPEDWKWSLKRQGSSVFLNLEIPDSSGPLEKGRIHFFCDDMQVDSDQSQDTKFPHSGNLKLIQELPVPDFAPKNPAKLSGLLFNAKGWPGIASNYVEVSIPWPPDQSENE